MGTRSLSLPPCSRVLQRSCWESSQGCQKVISGAPLSGLVALGRVPPTRIHFQLQHPLEIGYMLQRLTELLAIAYQPLLPYLPYLLVYRPQHQILVAYDFGGNLTEAVRQLCL